MIIIDGFIKFCKNFTQPSFCSGYPKNRLINIYFDSGFQNIALSSLWLFSLACYQVDLDDIQ